MDKQQLTRTRAANPRDTYARDRIRFLERIIFDLIDIIDNGEHDEQLLELKVRLCAERGGV